MKNIAVCLLALLLVMPLHAQFKGTVYVDKDKSGSLNEEDETLSGVRVTDGCHVATTDSKGRFVLPGYERTRFISVTTPAGYETRRFYWPVKENRKQYDFLLTESERTRDVAHSFVQITDTEVTGGLGRWVTDLQQYIRNEQPAFLVHTGDICYEAGLKMHGQVVNDSTMGCPVYYCIGNHDLVKGKYGEELYESIYGPTWYSFDVGHMHYVVTPMAHGDYPTGYTQQEVYEWLKNDLSLMRNGQELILFNHDLLTAADRFEFKGNEGQVIDLRKYCIKAWIYGHMHYSYVRNQDGVYTICTGTLDKGGIDHSPSSFREIKVDDKNELSTMLRYAFVEPKVTIVSPLDNRMLAEDAVSERGLVISVNTYDSQAKTAGVSFQLTRVDNGDWVADGVLNSCTDWNWRKTVNLPRGMKGKELRLSVVSSFTDGRKAATESCFTIGSTEYKAVAGEDWNTLLQTASHAGGVNCSQVKLPLHLQWTVNAGNNIWMCSPIIAGGKVLVATADDNVSLCSSVQAYDFNTGSLLWKFPTANSVKNSMAHKDGVVVVQDAACNLYALEVETGRLLWKKEIDLKGYPYLTEGLTVEDGVVYAGIGKGLSAYDLKTGRKIWTNTEWTQREGATTTLTVAGDVLVSGSQWGGLYGNDKRTGRLLWTLSDNGLRNRGASPVYKEGKLWLISDKSFFLIAPETGRILLQKELSANLDVTSTPLVTGNEIVFGSADKGVIALDKSTLFIRWKAETQPSLVYAVPYSTTPQANVETSPVSSQGIVYVGAADGCLYALDLATGVVKDRYCMGAPLFATVAVSGNRMVAVDFAGNVYCFLSE